MSYTVNGWKYDGPPLQKIPAASKVTGMSMYALRKGCRNGTIPHVMAGNVYLINIPALLAQIGVKSDEE